MKDTASLAARLRERRAELLDDLAETEAALHRIEQGHYGLCVCCGKPIEAERLSLLPATRWCAACKQAYAGRRGIVQESGR